MWSQFRFTILAACLFAAGAVHAAPQASPPSLLAAALAVIPEPSAWMMALAAIACAGIVIARRP